MTLQNRVDPSGRLCAVQSRGMLMGNRGILHNDRNEIIKPRAHKAWVTCLLEYKGIKRPKPFSKGSYSELFFLDEATAFAAGHLPCAYCQRARHLAFKASWVRANVLRKCVRRRQFQTLIRSFILNAQHRVAPKKRSTRHWSSCHWAPFSSTREVPILSQRQAICRGHLPAMDH